LQFLIAVLRQDAAASSEGIATFFRDIVASTGSIMMLLGRRGVFSKRHGGAAVTLPVATAWERKQS